MRFCLLLILLQAAIFLPSGLQAQLVCQSVNQTIDGSATPYYLDFDATIPDHDLALNTIVGPNYPWSIDPNSGTNGGTYNHKIVGAAGFGSLADAINAGTPIGSGSSFPDGWQKNINTTTFGSFAYIGVELNWATQHYGWVKLKVETNGDVVIDSTCFEATPGASIDAGSSTVASPTCDASFTFMVDPGDPCTVDFTDNSMGTNLTYAWDFGDGNQAILPNPSHTYAGDNSYTVTLIILDGMGCADTAMQTVNITGCSVGGGCVAAFNYSVDPSDDCQYNFSNNSTGGVGSVDYTWTFGDGNSSNSVSPSHTYTANGVYTVNLSMLDANNCTSSFSETITVTGCSSGTGGNDDCVALFSFFQSANNNCNIVFNNNSYGSGILSYLWDFGDGNTSTDTYPIHSYSGGGYYDVSLTVFSTTACEKTRTERIFFPGCGTSCEADFDFTQSQTNYKSFSFTNQSSNSPNIFMWDFGDGNTSTAGNPIHVYNTAGTYDVRLWVAKANAGCLDSVVKTVSFNATDIDDLASEIQLEIYPVPLDQDVLQIEAQLERPVSTLTIEVYNLHGQQVYAERLHNASASLQHEISLRDLPAGSYSIRVDAPELRASWKPFVKW